MLNVVMLSVVMLSVEICYCYTDRCDPECCYAVVIMLSVVMLSVVAYCQELAYIYVLFEKDLNLKNELF
jgi:hypothetical protein